MPTKNPRVNVVMEPTLYYGLKKIARKQKISLSLLARDLIKEAMELHEDVFWQKEAQARVRTYSRKKALTHKKVWE